MGRLMLSLILNEQLGQSTTTQEKVEESVPFPVAKWSASNAFDPDSDDFWSGNDVVYEAVVDPENPEHPANMDVLSESDERSLSEEAHLIATGNESQRRRRREQTWAALDNYINPEPSNLVRTEIGGGYGGNERRGEVHQITRSNRASARRVVRLNELERPVPMIQVSMLSRDRASHPSDPSLTTRGAMVHSRSNSSRFLSPVPQFSSPLVRSYFTSPLDMISDLTQRTASPSPIPSVSNRESHDDEFTQTPSIRHPNRPPHRRRESQPAPPSISLMS